METFEIDSNCVGFRTIRDCVNVSIHDLLRDCTPVRNVGDVTKGRRWRLLELKEKGKGFYLKRDISFAKDCLPANCFWCFCLQIVFGGWLSMLFRCLVKHDIFFVEIWKVASCNQ